MINHLNLHRTAKYFMDVGRASSPSEALDILKSFGLSIRISENAARTYNGQPHSSGTPDRLIISLHHRGS